MSDTELDIHSWLIFGVFVLILVCIVQPITVKIPKPGFMQSGHDQQIQYGSVSHKPDVISSDSSYVDPKSKSNPEKASLSSNDDNTKISITFDYGYGPLVGLLFLIITTSIGSHEIKTGIVGDENLQPYSILVLFFSLAYVCISLDLTGVFKWIALHTAKRSGSSGVRLFFYFFLLTTVMTVFTSNDIVILTLTPITCYFCAHIKSDPIPFLISQFLAAHSWSAAIYIGNPTNIIVAEAYRLTFVDYSQYMLAPAAISGVILIILTFWIYNSEIPRNISPPSLDTASALVDPKGAIGGLIWLLTCLIVLIATSFAHVSVWLITLPFGVGMLLRDLFVDFMWRGRSANDYSIETEMSKISNTFSDESSDVEYSKKKLVSNAARERTRSEILDEPTCCLSVLVPFQRRFPTVYRALNRMPWKIAPFMISMFILVEGLNTVGWVGIIATGLAKLIAGNGVFAAVFSIGFLSAFGCVLFNNQPMTILFTKLLQHPNFVNAASAIEEKGSLFALAMGSNTGANLALNGSLAGLMWITILKNKGVFTMTYFRFARLGMLVCIPVILGTSLIIALELDSESDESDR
jgi:Na+/H+ antiporter NhaD/arsenite permease-like protein